MKTILSLLQQKYVSCFRFANKVEGIMENTHFNFNQDNLQFGKKFIFVICPGSCFAGSIDAAY